MQDVTALLNAWSQGDREALDRLMPLVYAELRKLAHHYLQAERPGATTRTLPDRAVTGQGAVA